MKTYARCKKATFDYAILEKFEAGLELKGSEVKSIRCGRCNLKDSFVRIMKGEAFLFNSHISYLPTTNPHYKFEENRVRKLLLNRKEIDKIEGKVSKDGMSIVALSLYANKKNRLKLQIAVAKGKKLYDKREDIKQRDLNKELQREFKNRF